MTCAADSSLGCAPLVVAPPFQVVEKEVSNLCAKSDDAGNQ
jgi:hypothetical protein